MSSENTNYDVNVHYYKCTIQDMVRIKFFNDTEELLGDRVIVSIIDNTIYLEPSKAKGSLKVSKGSCIQICNATATKYKELEGSYDLKQKTVDGKDIYYLEKIGEVKHNSAYGNIIGTEKTNYKSHISNRSDIDNDEASILPVSSEVSLTKTSVNMMNAKSNKEKDAKILELMFKILKFQIGNNKEALSTIADIEAEIDKLMR